MSEMQIAQDVASHKFESLSDTIILDEMPDRDADIERGIGEGQWMRMAAVILQDDSEQLYAKFDSEEIADYWIGYVEDLQAYIRSRKAGTEILDACVARLLVCCHRYALDNDLVPHSE